MKQSIRELWGPENLKDTGSRECYYFYISLHLSPILKQLLMFLSCPCTCTWSRVGPGYSYKAEPEGVLGQRLGAWEKAGSGNHLSGDSALESGWQPWGNWTPTSDVWASGAPLNSLELCLCLLKDALQTWLIPCPPSQSGCWVMYLSWPPASDTLSLGFSTFSPIFPIFCIWGFGKWDKSQAGKDLVYNNLNKSKLSIK